MTLHRTPHQASRFCDVALSACLLLLLATIVATAGAALQPQREAQVVISYGCDAGETSPG